MEKLVGMFFLRDNGQSYCTGEIKAVLGNQHVLVLFHSMNPVPANVTDTKFGVVSLNEITEMMDDDDVLMPSWSLFETRKALDDFLRWLDSPSQVSVVDLASKRKK